MAPPGWHATGGSDKHERALFAIHKIGRLIAHGSPPRRLGLETSCGGRGVFAKVWHREGRATKGVKA